MAQTSSSDLEVALEVRLADNSGYIHGQYNVEICIVSGNNSAEQDECPGEPAPQIFKNVTIINGFYSFIITQFNLTHFNKINPYFLISLDPIDSSADALITSFPVPSTPYAIHAMEADYAHKIAGLSVNAEFKNITINGVLSVVNNGRTVFYVSDNVGVLTSEPNYPFDVNGNVNASNYLVDGVPLEEKFAWKRSGNDLYYTGNVGIGRKPKGAYALDVSGNINAEAFYVSGNSLLKILSAGVWQKVRGENDIYINLEEGAKIGIGVSKNLNEMLEVSGAIRIGDAQRVSPLAGTIEFDNDANDFYGYVSGSQGKNVIRRSLTGVQFDHNPEPDQLLKWNSELKIVGIPTSDFTVSQNGFVGIGTSNPSALFTVVGKNDNAIMDVKYQQNGKSKSAFFISKEGEIGVNTPTPGYDFDVNGVLNAKEIYVNGVDVASLTNQDLYWQAGSQASPDSVPRIYYNRGYVGIGTDSPRNLLEISNLTPTGNAAITFDLDNDDKFTIGIQGDQEDVSNCNSNVSESFVFSTGSDLKTPILSFNQDRIGIGIDCPQATFHVQSDTGFLVEGTYSEDSDAELLELSGSYMYFYPKLAAFRAGTFQANAEVGSFSVAFGRNNEASAKGSVVVGGSDNQATGDHSSVLGGRNNIASGDGSVALGQYACAEHRGSFVWNSQFYNTDTDAACFSSSRANQFLVNAQGGVGIGTPTTNLSALTVKMNSNQQNYIASFYGINSNENVNIYKTGLVGIGLSDSDYLNLDASLKLAVSGNVMVGPPINSQSLMTINYDQSQSGLNHVFSVYTNSLNPAFVINRDGNIGVGGINPSFQLHVSGNVYAKRVLYKTDDGYKLLESLNSPWSSDDDYNIYRSTGKVGIGTDSPTSLLTLAGDKPELSFVNNGPGRQGFAMGIITPNNTFMIQAFPTLNTAVGAPLIITQNKVGMGLFIGDVPEATLHVSGDMYVQGSIGIATTNFTYPLNVGGIASFEQLYVNGFPITPTISPWQSNSVGNFIYVTSNVGVLIGGYPSDDIGGYTFRVLGNAGIDRVSANALEAVSVSVNRLSFRGSSTDRFLQLNNGELEFCSDTDDCKQIFEGLQYSDQSNASGPLAFWSADDTISRLPAFWNADVNQLSLTGNMSIQSYRNDENDIYITSNIHIGNGNNAAFEMNLSLDHGEIVNNGFVNSFYASKIGVHLQNYWNSEVEKNLVGLDISMTKDEDTSTVGTANVIGLHVEVTDLNGLSAAAVFNGGPILITNEGISQPNSDVLLHVDGGIQADAINIDDGLSLTGDLEVYSKGRAFFEVKEDDNNNLPYIAVGGAIPDSGIMLNVSGSVQVSDIEVLDRIEAASLQVGDDGVVVSTDGRVGFGAVPSNPFTQVYISNRVSINQGVTHVAEKVDVDLSYASDSNASYTFTDSVTAMDIDIRNSREGDANIAGTLVGIDVTISQNVSCETNCDIVGLNVNVGDLDTLNPNRISAVFTGGGVGIGKEPAPGMMLDVSGNISVEGIAFDALQLDYLTANRLIVNTAEFEILHSNQIYANNITVNKLNIDGSIELSALTLSTLNVTRHATFNAFSASNATFDDLEVNMFTVSEINAYMTSGLTINADVDVNGTLDVRDVQLGNVRFNSYENESSLPGDVSKMLYVLGSDLYFNETNLTSFYTGEPNSIAVVNEDGAFVSTPLKYVQGDDISKFILDGMSTPSPTLFKVSGNINPSSDFIAHDIHLKLSSGSGNNRYTGMAIQIDSDVDEQGNNYELGANEEAVGLKVDLTGIPSDATKNAALFYGGNVGVGIQAPTALLHIKQENSETPLFNIENSSGGTIFKINQTGQVGINTNPDESAQLVIQNSGLGFLKVGNALQVNANGEVGIGDSPITDYQLFVSGNMNVNNMLYVSGNHVSIGGPPEDDYTFYVARSSVFNEVQASTANITSSLITNGSLIVSKNYNQGGTISGFSIGLSLGTSDTSEVDQVTGLDINLSSDYCFGGDSKCTIANGKIYGLYVNLDDLGFPTESGSVTLNSAVFLGGNVGIGTDQPKYPLHIQSPGNNLSDLIGFTYSNESNPITLRFQSFSNDSGAFIGVSLGDDQETEDRIVAFSSQKMIINYTNTLYSGALNSNVPGSLVVNGSLQIGAKDRESKLYLGETYFQLTTNNTLNLVIPTSNASESKSRFNIGANIDNTFTPFFSINASGNVAILGMDSDLSTLDDQNYLLYVANSNSTSIEEPVVVFHNVRNLPVTTLLEMRISADQNINVTDNYIVFSRSNEGVLEYLGAIEGNGQGGVQYTTGGADYAEYLEKKDVNETIEKGDIVGVLNGKVSKKTDGAQHFLVRSSSAAVAGNWPGNNLSQFSLIAFMGQVLVKVNGPVKLGDFIIPSGRQDGTGIAVSEDQLTMAQQTMIVGRAWSSSDDISEKLVLCAVGTQFSAPNFSAEIANVQRLEKRVNALAEENKALSNQLDRLSEQEVQIQSIIDRFK